MFRIKLNFFYRLEVVVCLTNGSENRQQQLNLKLLLILQLFYLELVKLWFFKIIIVNINKIIIDQALSCNKNCKFQLVKPNGLFYFKF